MTGIAKSFVTARYLSTDANQPLWSKVSTSNDCMLIDAGHTHTQCGPRLVVPDQGKGEMHHGKMGKTAGSGSRLATREQIEGKPRQRGNAAWQKLDTA